MDWELWRVAQKKLEEHRLVALLGVVPDCQDPDLQLSSPNPAFWDVVKELQSSGFKIAMHGYKHVFDSDKRGLVDNRHDSEFAGHPFEVQFEKIKVGKDIFLSHGIETDVFFAPAHSYDDNTLKALAANGFKYISDGKSSKPYKKHGIICLPCRHGGIPKIKKSGYYTAVMHVHEWKRPEKKKRQSRFMNLCDQYSDDIVSFDEYCKQPCGNVIRELAKERLFLLWQRYLLPFLVNIKHRVI